jgi:hypothetical protein
MYAVTLGNRPNPMLASDEAIADLLAHVSNS